MIWDEVSNCLQPRIPLALRLDPVMSFTTFFAYLSQQCEGLEPYKIFHTHQFQEIYSEYSNTL